MTLHAAAIAGAALATAACSSRPPATVRRDEPAERIATSAPTPDAAPAADAAPAPGTAPAPAFALPAPAADDDDPSHPLALGSVYVTVERMYPHGRAPDELPGYNDAVSACFRAIPRADRPPRLPYEVRIEPPPLTRPARLAFAPAGGAPPRTATDPRFTGCVTAAMPSVDELRRFDIDHEPRRGEGPGMALAFIVRASTRSADGASQGRLRSRAP